MYASVTTGKIQPGKVEEYLTIYRESVKPVMEKIPGLKHVYGLADPETGEGMTIGLYETKADAERTQASGDYQKVAMMLASTLVLESLARKGYEVIIEV
jgi:hypothetical protein